MASNILILNCGSSSLKFSVINPENGEELCKGLAERLVGEKGVITIKFGAEKIVEEIAASHQAALDKIVEALKKFALFSSIKAIGHRIVHGGEFFRESVLVDDEALNKIKACIPLAPLHNPAHVIGIEAAHHSFPNLPQVAVFDTAFHQKMPEKAYLYAIPYHLYQDYKIRRYGFHGTSYRYIAEQLPRFIDKQGIKAVVCHLGNGGSVAAIYDNHSLDTTMGLTPLEGVVHGTRSGDIDPGVFAILQEQANLDLKEIDQILWKKSGLLGLSQMSNDCRELEEAAEKGDVAAIRALDVYIYRLAKNIAAQMVALNGADVLVFTGGIGENSSYIREKALASLEFLGFAIDKDKNNATIRGQEGNIATANSKPVLVIPTNEELMIARDTAHLTE